MNDDEPCNYPPNIFILKPRPKVPQLGAKLSLAGLTTLWRTELSPKKLLDVPNLKGQRGPLPERGTDKVKLLVLTPEPQHMYFIAFFLLLSTWKA